MKSSKKMFVLAEAVLAVMILIVSISMFREKSGEERGKVSVIVQNSDDSSWASFKYGLRMAAQDQEMEMIIVGTGEVLSAEEEYEAIKQEIDNGADAVIVQPVPEKGTLEMLRKVEKKVPVVLVEQPVTTGRIQGIPVVEPDNYSLGKTLAEELLNDYNGRIRGKRFGIVSKHGISKTTLDRKEGFLSMLEGKGAEVSWDISDFSSDKDETILERKAKVDVVIALDDYSLVLAGKTASANDLHGALVYGIGNSVEAVYCLDTGYVQCLVVPDGFHMGYQSLTEVAESLGHLFKNPQSQTVSYTVMHRDTLFSKENQEILFTMSQ